MFVVCKRRDGADRMLGITVAVVFEENVMRLICGYALQCGRCLEEKPFYDGLKCEWDMHSAGDLVMCLGDLNGHVDGHIDGFVVVHGDNGVGHSNLKGRM